MLLKEKHRRQRMAPLPTLLYLIPLVRGSKLQRLYESAGHRR